MADAQAYQPWHEPIRTEPHPPASLRICSLLPSATDIVSRLGLTPQLVCVTHCCDAAFDQARLQEQLQAKQTLRVTSSWIKPNTMSQHDIDAMVTGIFGSGQPLYGIDAAALAEKKPTLVITQDLCDVCAPNSAQATAACVPARPQDAGASSSAAPHIISTSPCSLLELADSFLDVAEACGVRRRGEEMRRAFLADLHRVCRAVAPSPGSYAAAPSAFVLEWIDPPFDAGHWVPELVQIASGRPERSSCHQELAALDEAASHSARQPHASAQWSGSTKSKQVTWEQVAAADPDVLISCSCGFDVARNKADAAPVLQRHAEASKLRAVRERRVFAVDGNRTLSRPGPCLAEGAAAVAACIWDGHAPVQQRVMEAFPSLRGCDKQDASLLWSKIEL